MRMILASVLLAIAWPAQASSEFHRQLIEIERNLPAQAKTLRTRAADPVVAQQLDELSQWVRWLAEHETDAGIQRKARSLEVLLEQAREAPESLAFGAPPSLAPTNLSDDRVGRSCEAAIPFELGTGRRVALPAGESRWFRVDLRDPSLVRVSSRGSTIDASLDIHADCRMASSEPVARGDDEYGLQAEVAVPSARQTFWYARLTNEGDQTGEANIFATQTATLQGTVRSRVGDLPVENRQISLWRAQGQTFTQVTSTLSNAAGNWSIAFMEPGTYAIRTRQVFGSPGLLDQAFSNIPCRSGADIRDCGTPGNHFTPVDLVSGETRTIDFRLDAGAIVTGVVRHAQTLQPLPGARVLVGEAGSTGNPISAVSDSLGRYRAEGLFPGTAFLAAGADGFEGRLFDGVPCSGFDCTPGNPAGTPLAVSLASPATANFALPPASQIRVAVTVAGQPVSPSSNFRPAGRLYLSTGQFVTSVQLGDQGRLVFPSVAAGTYRLMVISDWTVPQMYESVPCTTQFCDVELALGTPIVVPPSAGAIDLTIDLRWAPSIFGRVVEDPSGAPVRDAEVRLVPTQSPFTRTTRTDATGRYRFDGVPPGSYRLLARSPLHADMAFDGIPCELENAGCDGATLIPRAYSSPDFEANFFLRPSGRIEIVIAASSTANSFATAGFQLFTPSGQQVASFAASVGQGGVITLNDVPPGTYLLAATLVDHVAQLHPFVDCVSGSVPAGCPLATATPITVTSGATVTGIRFHLRRSGGALPVRVRSAADATPLSGVPIDIWNLAGIRVGVESTRFDGIAWIGRPSQFQSGPLQAFLSTDNQQGFIDEVYDNRRCPNGPAFLGLCPLTGGTIVTIPETGTAGQLEIQLDPRDDLFTNGFEL